MPACPSCKSQFRIPKDLKAHQRTTGHCYCQSCDLYFPSDSLHAQHPHTDHNVAYPLECKECSAGFYAWNELEGHKIATGHLFCAQCGICFREKVALDDHKRINHFVKSVKVLRPVGPDYMYTGYLDRTCPLCLDSLPSPEDLSTHSRNPHDFSCGECVQTFVTHQALRAHWQSTNHLYCSSCQELFPNTSLQREHYSLIHGHNHTGVVSTPASHQPAAQHTELLTPSSPQAACQTDRAQRTANSHQPRTTSLLIALPNDSAPSATRYIPDPEMSQEFLNLLDTELPSQGISQEIPALLDTYRSSEEMKSSPTKHDGISLSFIQQHNSPTPSKRAGITMASRGSQSVNPSDRTQERNKAFDQVLRIVDEMKRHRALASTALQGPSMPIKSELLTSRAKVAFPSTASTKNSSQGDLGYPNNEEQDNCSENSSDTVKASASGNRKPGRHLQRREDSKESVASTLAPRPDEIEAFYARSRATSTSTAVREHDNLVSRPSARVASPRPSVFNRSRATSTSSSLEHNKDAIPSPIVQVVPHGRAEIVRSRATSTSSMLQQHYYAVPSPITQAALPKPSDIEAFYAKGRPAPAPATVPTSRQHSDTEAYDDLPASNTRKLLAPKYNENIPRSNVSEQKSPGGTKLNAAAPPFQSQHYTYAHGLPVTSIRSAQVNDENSGPRRARQALTLEESLHGDQSEAIVEATNNGSPAYTDLAFGFLEAHHERKYVDRDLSERLARKQLTELNIR